MINSVTNTLTCRGVFKDHSDGSIKSVFATQENRIIEITMLFNKSEYDVLCVPTHHFCNLGCKMCHLTNNKLNKKMQPIVVSDLLEGIIKSLSFFGEWENQHDITVAFNSLIKRTDKKKLLISYMGVGEPLLNLQLIEDLFLHEDIIKECYGYTDICYAISTMMPNDNMTKLKTLVGKYSLPLKLHFSLHSPFDEERFQLIPSTKIGINDALKMLVEYSDMVKSDMKFANTYLKFHTDLLPVELHYTLIKGNNDTHAHLDMLINLLREFEIPIKFIRFNPINLLERSEMESIWVERIKKHVPNIKVKTYSPPGREIGSSCGEFTKHYYHGEIETQQQADEFFQWEKTHLVYEDYKKDCLNLDEYYMGIAAIAAKRSRDPSTQVGACLVSGDNRLLSVGYNDVPDSVDLDSIKWTNRENCSESKYTYIIHAEMNAVANMKESLSNLFGATLYVTLFPCNECARLLTQCGVKRVVYLDDKYHDSNFTVAARNMFDKGGVECSPLVSSKELFKTILS